MIGGKITFELPARRLHQRPLRTRRGGEPMDGARYIWWNFVSSRKERIEQAKADWKQGRFDSVPEDRESIPLPEPEPQLVGPKVVNHR